jgi:pimeloyl-ACP methyl ester carboxylesterase
MNRLREGITSAMVEAEDGARIYYETRGRGPALLIMGGIGKSAQSSLEAVDYLAERRTVISYDRRGTYRSISDRERVLDIGQACRDILRVLKACETPTVEVFATCGGSSIALELITRYPDIVVGMLIHDPTAVSVLPDAERELLRFQSYYRTGVEQGYVVGMGAFLADHDLPFPPLFQCMFEREGRYCVEKEFMTMVTYLPDIAKLACHKQKIVMGAGEEGLAKGHVHGRVAKVLSEKIGCQFAIMPGNHTGYFQYPIEFASASLELLGQLTKKQAIGR